MKPDFFLWIRKHSEQGRKCDYCDDRHDNHKEYSFHLERDHPQEWEGMLVYYELNGRGTTVPQGTSKGE